jgi:Zn-dependent protease with chaperone function
MSAALLMCLYALVVGWCLPSPLARLTTPGMSARLSLTAWLTAEASVLVSLVVALHSLISAAVAGWSLLAEAVCRSVAGHACSPLVYRSAMFEIPLAAAAVAGALTAAALAWQFGRWLQRSRERTRAHAEAARITGRTLSAIRGAVILDVPELAAYCVPGRPPAIVLTSGAVAVLDRAQLAAVMAHEKAHLAGGHHLLVTTTRGLAAAFPAVPLFTRGAAEVARLTEMCADDTAARTSGRNVLVSALLAMGTGVATPHFALAATAGSLTVRVQRLLEPPPRAQHARNWLALIAVTLLIAAASALLIWFADPLAAHARALLS